MRGTWQLQEAKNRLSELVRRAEEEGPQTITVRGEPRVVVVAAKEYPKPAPDRAGESLLDFFRRSPLWGAGLEIERDRGPLRDVDLGGD